MSAGLSRAMKPSEYPLIRVCGPPAVPGKSDENVCPATKRSPVEGSTARRYPIGRRPTQICRLNQRRECGVEPCHKAVPVVRKTAPESWLRSAGCPRKATRGNAPYEHLSGSRINRDGVYPVVPTAAEVGGLEERRERRVEPGHKPVENVINDDCAPPAVPGKSSELVIPAAPLSVRRINRDRADPFAVGSATTEVGRLEKRRERRVEPGHEAVHIAAPECWLRAASGTRKIA